jgi:N-acetyltransferase 10
MHICRTLIENGVRTNQRSLVILVGDRGYIFTLTNYYISLCALYSLIVILKYFLGRHQVVNLHYILSKSVVKARPSVLWCYKSELGFSRYVIYPFYITITR